MLGLHVLSVALLCLLASGGLSEFATAGEEAPAARVARWKDDKKAAFLLMFDDNMPSHLKNAIPELKKRNFTGTFYVCPGNKGLFTPAWAKDVPAAGMVLANHTMNHKFVADAAELEGELKACNEALAAVYADRKQPFLLSFGQPGTQPPWKLSSAQIKEVLPEYHLVDRGPFLGAAIHYKTGKDMTAAVDKAIAGGAAGYIVFHGVGGEWISASMPDFIQLLDYLISKQEQVWVTDHISSHKYDTERKTAEVKTVKKDDNRVQLLLTCQADPKLYDQPLTLIVPVPAGWQKCAVTQGERKATVEVVRGEVRCDAVPSAEPISLEPAK